MHGNNYSRFAVYIDEFANCDSWTTVEQAGERRTDFAVGSQCQVALALPSGNKRSLRMLLSFISRPA
jgi:hypothetical protein